MYGGGGGGDARAQSQSLDSAILSLDDGRLTLGAAFGDGLARQPLLRSAVALDSFERAYLVDLTGKVAVAR
jgi:hypothetical protein